MALDIGTLIGYLKLDTSNWDKNSDDTERKGSAFAKKAVMWGAAAGAGLAAASKVLYDLGGTFDDVTDTIRVGTGATGKALEGLSDSAKKIATEVPASFEDSAAMVADLNTRLGLTGPRLEKVAKQMLEAGRLTGEAIDTQSMTAALSVFDVSGKQTSKVLDDIYRVSQATGLSMNDLAKQVSRNGPVMKQFGFDIGDSAALLGTLDKAGLDGNRTMATLSRAMVEFAKSGKDPKKALGDTVDEIGRLTKAGKDAEATNLAAKIFGTRGASQFVAAIKAGKVNLDDLMGATGATSDTILKASKDTADFSEKWEMFKNKTLLRLEPLASKVFNAFGDGLDKVAPLVDKFFQGMEDGTGAGGALVKVAENLVDIGGDVVGFFKEHTTVAKGLAAVLLTLVVVTKAHAAVMAVQAAGGLLKYLQATKLVTAVTKVWTAVQWAMNAALSANPIGIVIVVLAALVAALIVAYRKSETFRDVVKAVVDGVGAAWRWLWNSVLQPVFKLLVSGIAWIMDKFGDMLDAMSHVPGFGWAKTAADAMHGAADKARELADNIKKIPPKKDVYVNYHETTIRSIISKQANDPKLNPHGATGGLVTAPTMALIGEAGPELVIPLNRTPGSSPLPEGLTAGGRQTRDAPYIGTLEVVAERGASREDVHATISGVVTAVGLAARAGRWEN